MLLPGRVKLILRQRRATQQPNCCTLRLIFYLNLHLKQEHDTVIHVYVEVKKEH